MRKSHVERKNAQKEAVVINATVALESVRSRSRDTTCGTRWSDRPENRLIYRITPPLFPRSFFRGGRRREYVSPSFYPRIFYALCSLFLRFCFRVFKVWIELMAFFFSFVCIQVNFLVVHIWDLSVSSLFWSLLSLELKKQEHYKMEWWSRMTTPLRSFCCSVASRLGFRKRGEWVVSYVNFSSIPNFDGFVLIKMA